MSKYVKQFKVGNEIILVKDQEGRNLTNSVNERVTVNAEAIANVKTRLSNDEDTIYSVRNKANANEENISALSNRVILAEGDIDDVADSVSSLSSSLSTTNDNLDVLSARMDEFASLPEGSTSADAELLDIRIGDDGITYSSAGVAVRTQFADIKSAFHAVSYSAVAQAVMADGTLDTVSGYKHALISVNAGDVITVYGACLSGSAVLSESLGSDLFRVIYLGSSSTNTEKKAYTYRCTKSGTLAFSFNSNVANMAFITNEQDAVFVVDPLVYDNESSVLADCDDAPNNSLITVLTAGPSYVANLPSFISFNRNKEYLLITYKNSRGVYTFKEQLLMDVASGQFVARRRYNGTAWQSWSNLSNEGKNTYSIPAKMDYSLCSSTASATNLFVSDKVIPAGNLIKTFKFYAETSYPESFFYVIDSTTNEIVYKQWFEVKSGWNTININYLTKTNCIWGFEYITVKYGHYSTTALGSDYEFSSGLVLTSPVQQQYIGDIISYSVEAFSGERFVVPVQIECVSDSALASYDYRQAGIKEHPPIVCFIDDDCRSTFPSIWGEVLSVKDIRIGLACITSLIGTQNYMTLQQLQAYYQQGHEVYSHSYSHPDFNSESTNVNAVEEQCWKSKRWLKANGFDSDADIIVYPGGINQNSVSGNKKIAVAQQIFKYGVNAWGGVCAEPTNFGNVPRINADTATLSELEDAVDLAVSQNSMVVFMSHSYEMSADSASQIAKLKNLIDYINTTDAEIMPFGEAMHRIYGW